MLKSRHNTMSALFSTFLACTFKTHTARFCFTHPVKTRHSKVQMRMNTWLNMAECVLWMARWKSFWRQQGTLLHCRFTVFLHNHFMGTENTYRLWSANLNINSQQEYEGKSHFQSLYYLFSFLNYSQDMLFWCGMQPRTPSLSLVENILILPH